MRPAPPPFLIEPPLDLRRVLHKEAGKEITFIELEGIGVSLLIESLVEGRGVAPKQIRIDPDIPVGPAGQGVLAQRPAEVVQRLAERVAGSRIIGFRPEKAEQRIPAVEAFGVGRSEENE